MTALEFSFDPKSIRITESEILADLTYPHRDRVSSKPKSPLRRASRRPH